MASETTVQQQVRLLHARMNGQNWRNNVGAGLIVDEYGNERQVRWGLANESAQQNAVMKSSDIIGITPITIQPHHVGRIFGVFTALETKRPGWHLTPGDKRGLAQQKFIDIVRNVGGFAGFVTDPADIYGIIQL